MSKSSQKDPLRPIELMLTGALFALLYFFGSVTIFILFPALLETENIFIPMLILSGFVQLILAGVIISFFKVYDRIQKNSIFFPFVLAFIFIFSPIPPILIHLSIPVIQLEVCHPDCPIHAEIAPKRYEAQRILAPVWHVTEIDDSIFFPIAPYYWGAVIASLLWLSGPVIYLKNKRSNSYKNR